MVAKWHAQKPGLRIGLVPTMGNLHAGHLSLVTQIGETVDKVVVSIFVNPTQFGAGEDFASYPSTIAADLKQLEQMAVDMVFLPSVAEMYPPDLASHAIITLPKLSTCLCGAFRPGHFDGVATIVAKLFNIVEPHVAIFGEKDYQQLVVIRQMVRHLNMPVEILGAATVRDHDGLAMSSRNAYLTASERIIAVELYNTLCWAQQQLQKHHRMSPLEIEASATQRLDKAGFKTEYFRIVDSRDFTDWHAEIGHCIIIAASWLGRTRLIDNMYAA